MLDVRPGPTGSTLTEPVHAWRTWTIVGSRDATDVRLYPIAGTGRMWPVRKPMRASCVRRWPHDVPGVGCRCGIHGTRDVDPLRRTRDPAVLGTVALWGRILEHEHGFRAAFGYPQRLALICQLCFWQRGARGADGCDVVVRHRGGRLVPLCDEHLALAQRHAYPVRRLLDPAAVQSALLDAYAVDVLAMRASRAAADAAASEG